MVVWKPYAVSSSTDPYKEVEDFQILGLQHNMHRVVLLEHWTMSSRVYQDILQRSKPHTLFENNEIIVEMSKNIFVKYIHTGPNQLHHGQLEK